MSPAPRVCDAVQRLLYSVCQCVLSYLFGLRHVNIQLNIQGGSFSVPCDHGSCIASLGLRVTAAALGTVSKTRCISSIGPDFEGWF